jgi:hypothetical protein
MHEGQVSPRPALFVVRLLVCLKIGVATAIFS